MKVLWLSWKDSTHPLAGGAETVSSQIRRRLIRDGHEVQLITSGYAGASNEEVVDGVLITRLGNRYTVYVKARSYYKQHLQAWPDLIIDEMNTIPFGAAFYAKRPTVLLTYQLARKVWFYQMPQPFSTIGYLLEPLYLRRLARRYETVITESNSTRNELLHYGFTSKMVHVFRVGMDLKPIERLPVKKDRQLVLSLGALRPMKRTLDIVKAFEVARDANPELELVVAGSHSSAYGQKVQRYAQNSRHAAAIHLKGHVSAAERLSLMRQAAVILVTSVKEGWGLIVTEANSQGTPAIAYDTDGLRDSIRKNKTGVLVPDGDYIAMGEAVITLLKNVATYSVLRKKAWEWSHEFTFENSYQDFCTNVGIPYKSASRASN